jgi:mannose-1-phosphate guanylyltransferase
MEHPDEPFFVVQADCIRVPEDAFLDMVTSAGKIVASNKKYITGGLKATEPNLGVDYLQLGEKIADSFGQEVYTITEFLGRRSSYQETRKLIENFHIVTHCNHSCWYPDLMLDAYKQYRPDWHKALMKMRDAIGKPGEDATINEIYHTMEKGPTEEVTKHLLKGSQIILLPFQWTDIGTWNSVYEFANVEPCNYEDGKVLAVDTKGTLIKSHDKEKLIAVAGLEDMVIVDTPDVLLIIPKHKMEMIKDIQTKLAERDEKSYL